jgi:hypothetical protein
MDFGRRDPVRISPFAGMTRIRFGGSRAYPPLSRFDARLPGVCRP